VISNVIAAPSQALQVIFQMQSQGSSQKRAVKKIIFFKLQNFFFFILTPLTSVVHNFLIYFFKLSDLNCPKIAILSSTNHNLTPKVTQ
jgi:hypothetical protein